MEITYIYALCEPGTRTVRYIGKANDLNERLKQHVQRSVKLNSPLGEWLRSLQGVVPAIVTLCETSPAFWQDDEVRYIRSARMLGMNLVNSTDGGEGIAAPTQEIRTKISAAMLGKRRGPHSPETRAKISTAKKGKSAWWCRGRKLSAEHKAKLRESHIGKDLSAEHRAKLSAAKLGKKLSNKHIALRSASQTGKKRSPETRARMSASAKARWAKEKI